jgi:hypothetical protein
MRVDAKGNVGEKEEGIEGKYNAWILIGYVWVQK